MSQPIQESQSITHSIKSWLHKSQQSIFSHIGPYLDRSYNFVKAKQHKTRQEEEFLKSYEFFFMSQATSFLFMTMSTYWMVKLFLKRTSLTQVQQRRSIYKAGLAGLLGAINLMAASTLNSESKVLDQCQYYEEIAKNDKKNVIV